MRALLDSNVLIDYLNGIDAARKEMAHYERAMISSIRWIEVIAGVLPHEEDAVRAFLRRFERVSVDAAVSERAVVIRRVLAIADAGTPVAQPTD